MLKPDSDEAYEQADRFILDSLQLILEIGSSFSRMPPCHLTGLSAGSLKCLAYLAKGPMTMGELAAALKISTPAATALIRPLANSRYVVREQDPRDRRVIRVSLTKEARELTDEHLSQWIREVEWMYEGADPQTRTAIFRSLTRLGQILSLSREERMARVRREASRMPAETPDERARD